MRHTITVRFKDGSGWLFTTSGGGMWTVQDLKNGRASSRVSHIPNDRRLLLIGIALDAHNVTITTGE